MNTRIASICGVLLVAMTSTLGRGQTPPADIRPLSPETAPIPAGKPWEPRWGQWPKYPGDWMRTHLGFVAQAKKTPDSQIVYFGDSITIGWTKQKAWEKLNAGWKALNFGIGGDGTSQVLYRIKNGELEPLNPKVIVLNIGTNNLYNDANGGTDAEIAQGIEAIITTANTLKPDAKILLVGILPRQNEYFTKRILAINTLLKKYSEGKTVTYVDHSDNFQESLGKMKSDLYAQDLVHLTSPGYDLWEELLRPELDKLIK